MGRRIAPVEVLSRCIVLDLILPSPPAGRLLHEKRAVERTHHRFRDRRTPGLRESSNEQRSNLEFFGILEKPFDPQNLKGMVDRAHRHTHN